MKIFFLAIPVLLLFSCGQKKYDEPHVVISTNVGDIELELYPKKAPKTVTAFLSYVDQKMYDNGSFYRVIKKEEVSSEYNSGLVQGGIIKTAADKYSKLAGIPHESPRETGLSHTNGTISLARTTPGSASSEFFICIGDQTQFDSSRRTNPDGLGFAAFGKVIKGMSVVRKIQAEKNNGDEIITPIKITGIRKL